MRASLTQRLAVAHLLALAAQMGGLAYRTSPYGVEWWAHHDGLLVYWVWVIRPWQPGASDEQRQQEAQRRAGDPLLWAFQVIGTPSANQVMG